MNKKNRRVNRLLGRLAVGLMLAAMALFTGCPNKITVKPETFAVTFSAGEHGTLKAKADGVTETDKSSITVEKGKIVTFTAKLADGYEVEKWTVNGTAVANNVSTTYSYKVTAAVTVKVSFKVKPPSVVAVTEVTLNKSALTLEEGKSEQLTATVVPANAANKKVTWSSNKPDVVAVDKDGKVTAHKTGEATITVTTTDGGKTASCKVNVTAKPPTTYKITFSVDGTGGTLKAKADDSELHTGDKVEQGKTVTFTATADEGYKIETWSISGSSFESGSGTDGSTTAKMKVTANTTVQVTFKLDDFVTITPPASGITYMDPLYALPGNEVDRKGAFRAGRKVKLSPYKLGKTEVTYKLWKEVYDWATGNGYTFANEGLKGKYGSGTEKDPVTMVSWRDCIVWCNAYTQKMNNAESECVYRKSKTDLTVLKDATAKEGKEFICDKAYADTNKKGYRLPTEAEWEYAARWQSDDTNAEKYGEVWLTKLNSASGAKGKWDTSEMGEVTWYGEDWGLGKTHPVGKKRANALGLYDMSGNVWEWCWDWSNDDPTANDSAYKSGDLVSDPQGAAFGSNRVIRGGSWGNDAEYCLVGFRNSSEPDAFDPFLGFRWACRS